MIGDLKVKIGILMYKLGTVRTLATRTGSSWTSLLLLLEMPTMRA